MQLAWRACTANLWYDMRTQAYRCVRVEAPAHLLQPKHTAKSQLCSRSAQVKPPHLLLLRFQGRLGLLRGPEIRILCRTLLLVLRNPLRQWVVGRRGSVINAPNDGAWRAPLFRSHFSMRFLRIAGCTGPASLPCRASAIC